MILSKFMLLEKLEQGTKLVIGQHGGHYGIGYGLSRKIIKLL